MMAVIFAHCLSPQDIHAKASVMQRGLARLILYSSLLLLFVAPRIIEMCSLVRVVFGLGDVDLLVSRRFSLAPDRGDLGESDTLQASCSAMEK